MPKVTLPELEVTNPNPVAVIMNDGSTFSSKYLWGDYTSYHLMPYAGAIHMENLERCFRNEKIKSFPTATEIKDYFEILRANEIPRVDEFMKAYYAGKWQTMRYTVSHFMHVVTEKYDFYPLIVDIVFKNNIQLLQELLGDSDSVALNRKINFLCRIVDKFRINNDGGSLKNCIFDCADTFDYLFALEAIEKDLISPSIEYIFDHEYWAMAHYVLLRTEFQPPKIKENMIDGMLFVKWRDKNTKTELTDASLACFKLLCAQYMIAGVNLLEKINHYLKDIYSQSQKINSTHLFDIALHHPDVRVLTEFLNVLSQKYTPKEVSDSFDLYIQKLPRNKRLEVTEKFEIADKRMRAEKSATYTPVLAPVFVPVQTVVSNNNNEVVSAHLPNLNPQ